MHDPWTDRLSEYLDGELDAQDSRRLEEHLASCDECTAVLAALHAVVAAARSLQDREPDRDLWAGIAAGIGTQPSIPRGVASPAGDVVSIDDRRRRAARSFSFTIPQLAAAAVVLMTLSASAVWLATGNGGANGSGGVAMEGTIFQSVVPQQVRLASSTSALDDDDFHSLAALLADARDVLDPATVDVLERSLESIQDAIAAAEAALAADPGNPRLQRQLDSTLQRRQDLATRVTRVQRVQRGGA
jgi:hypothetical protein